MNSSIICTVDVVLLTLKNASLHVALLRREREPFAGTWALPGGYVHAQEDRDTQDAAERVLRDKARVQSPYLEQLATFSGPARDPRGWSLSVVYYALVSEEALSRSLSPELQLVGVDGLKGLPFDHQAVIEAAVARVRSKSVYSSLPVHLCPPEFTLPQLQLVYEALAGRAGEQGELSPQSGRTGRVGRGRGGQGRGQALPAGSALSPQARVPQIFVDHGPRHQRGLTVSLSIPRN